MTEKVAGRRDFLKVVGAGIVGAAVGAGATYSLSPPRVERVEVPAVKKPLPKDPLRFGIVTFLTGIFGPSGVAGLRAAEIWADEVNAAGGILGRKVELFVEDESEGVEKSVERFKKLTLEKKVDVIFGTESTATGLAFGPLAEDLHQLWLSWDGTTQKGLEETLPKAAYSFRSIYNEA